MLKNRETQELEVSRKLYQMSVDNSTYTIVTLKERPDLRSSVDNLTEATWPKFLSQDFLSSKVWQLFFEEWSEYQVALLDEDDKLRGTGLTVPIRWDGQLNTLPIGWNEANHQGLDDLAAGRTPTALSGFAITVDSAVQQRGFSAIILRAVLNIARTHDFHSVVVNVRPILKSNYPLIPIERYAYWTNANGEPFDPWMRVHARAGAKIIGVSPLAASIQGTVAQWEAWTNMKFLDSGQYIVKGALEPITIDREHNIGSYNDPNVWMIHSLLPTVISS